MEPARFSLCSENVRVRTWERPPRPGVLRFRTQNERAEHERAALEVQLCLHLLANPELSLEVNASVLSNPPRALVELMQTAPRLCREIGTPLLIANCFVPHPDREMPGVLAFANWLATTPAEVRKTLRPFRQVYAKLVSLGDPYEGAA